MIYHLQKFIDVLNFSCTYESNRFQHNRQKKTPDCHRGFSLVLQINDNHVLLVTYDCRATCR